MATRRVSPGTTRAEDRPLLICTMLSAAKVLRQRGCNLCDWSVSTRLDSLKEMTRDVGPAGNFIEGSPRLPQTVSLAINTGLSHKFVQTAAFGAASPIVQLERPDGR